MLRGFDYFTGARPIESHVRLKQKRYHYARTIVIASFFIVTIAYGVQYSFGVFLKPLEEEFSWTRAMISWVPSLFMFLQCTFAPFTGWFTDRYGPTRIVAIGGFFMGLGLVLTSYISTPWHLYVCYSVLVGVGISTVYNPVTTTVSCWFTQRRGLALGIVTAGIGLGTVIMSPMAGYLIATYGWRTSYLLMGLAAWLFIITGALFLRKQPGETGAQPYGEKTGPREENAYVESIGLSLPQALRTTSLQLFVLLGVLSGAAIFIVMYHLVAYAEGMEIPKVTAATFLSAIGGASIIGRISMGMLSDSLGVKAVLTFCTFL